MGTTGTKKKVPKYKKGDSVHSWELRYRKAKALKEELNLKVQQGELVEVEQVKQEAFKEGRRIRNAIMALRSSLSSRLAAESDANKVFAILDKEFRIVLQMERRKRA